MSAEREAREALARYREGDGIDQADTDVLAAEVPPVEVLRCPVHGIPDCSPLLNGCSLPNRLADAYAAGLAARGGTAAPTHTVHVTAEPVAEDVVWCESCEEWVPSGAPEGGGTAAAGDEGLRAAVEGIVALPMGDPADALFLQPQAASLLTQLRAALDATPAPTEDPAPSQDTLRAAALLTELRDWGSALVDADRVLNSAGQRAMVQSSSVGRDMIGYADRLRAALAATTPEATGNASDPVHILRYQADPAGVSRPDWLAERDARVRREALLAAADEFGVYIGDEDGEWWDGFRAAQREFPRRLVDLAEAGESS